MSRYNTPDSYGSVSKFFHWTIFILVATLLIVGLAQNYITNDDLRHQVLNVHKLVGLLVLLLMVLRIMWALKNPKPYLPVNTPLWEVFAERLVHFTLYAILIAMPLSGWLMSSYAGKFPNFFGLFNILLPVTENKSLAKFYSQSHTILAWTIVAVVSLHVLAALKHHFIDKDNVLRRMMPTKKY